MKVRSWIVIASIFFVSVGVVLALIWRPANKARHISLQEMILDARNGEIARLVISPEEVRVEYNDGTIALSRTYGRVDIATILGSSWNSGLD